MLHRPPLVHQIKELTAKVYTTKCGVKTEDKTEVSAWHFEVTCDECSPPTGARSEGT